MEIENSLRFEPYNPSYDEYFAILEEDELIRNYVSFPRYNSTLIFLNNIFIGVFRISLRDYDSSDMEIYIAILREYRGNGLAEKVLEKLCYNIFLNNDKCHFIHLSIDKENESSIRMAEKAGFKRNEVEEEDLRLYGDNRTLVFTKEELYMPDNTYKDFLDNKHSRLKMEGGLIILSAQDSENLPSTKEINKMYKDIKAFYIGEDKRIVLQYKPFIPNLDVKGCQTEGQKALARHDWESLIKYYTPLLSIKNTMPHVYSFLGLAYLHLGDITKAIDYLTVVTEIGKYLKRRKYDYTELINKLKGKPNSEETEEVKPNFKMTESDFTRDLGYDYNLTRLNEVIILMNFQGMTLEEACTALHINVDDENMMALLIAREYFIIQDFNQGKSYLQKVQKAPNKSERVKKLMQELELNYKFYSNRVDEDYQPLIRLRQIKN